MSSTTLAGLCDFVTDQVDPRDLPGAVYFGLEHLTSGRLVATGQGTAVDVLSSKSRFRTGDVLYGKLRPYLDKAILAECDGVCTTELLVLRPKPGISGRYLACVVHSTDFISHAVAGTTGAHHPRTSWHHIREFKLPEFTKPERDSITRLAWAVHDALRTSDLSLGSADRLKQVAMRELFARGLRGAGQRETDIGLIPEGWEVCSIADHFTLSSGGTPSRANPSFWSGGTIPWVKTAEVDYRVIERTEECITPLGLQNSAAKMLRPGTLLMAMYGQGVTRGKVAILGIEACCNQACAAFHPRDDAIQTKFLYYYLTHSYEELRRFSHGGQQQNLNMDIVRAFRVTHPQDHVEQRDIVESLEAIDQKIDLHIKKRVVLEELFRSLLHKLMTGEIRVSDLDLSALEQPTAAEVLA